MYRAIAFSTFVAAALAFSVPAGAQSSQKNMNSQSGMKGTSKFCHQQGSGTDAMNCIYASMDACQKISKAQGGNCVENPKMTTGSGSGSMKGSSGMKDNMKKN